MKHPTTESIEGKSISSLQSEGWMVLCTFSILWKGWEMDNSGWVVKSPSGKKMILMTNHGGLLEAGPSNLIEKMDEYNQVIIETQRALDVFLGKEK